jgi:hypothetical protein
MFSHTKEREERNKEEEVQKDLRMTNLIFRPARNRKPFLPHDRNGFDIKSVHSSLSLGRTSFITSSPVTRRPSIDAYTSQYAGYTAAGPHRIYTDFPNSYEISFLRT